MSKVASTIPAYGSKRETLQFTIKLGLRKGLALIRGMRRIGYQFHFFDRVPGTF
jgi:hypothetical protein